MERFIADASMTYPLRTAQRNLNKSLFGDDSSTVNKSTLQKHQNPNNLPSVESTFADLLDIGTNADSSYCSQSSNSNTELCSTNSDGSSTLTSATRISNIFIKRQSGGDLVCNRSSKSDSDTSSKDDQLAVKNDVHLSNNLLASPNLQQPIKKGVRNALISETGEFSPVHLPQVDHNGKICFFIFHLIVFCLNLIFIHFD